MLPSTSSDSAAGRELEQQRKIEALESELEGYKAGASTSTPQADKIRALADKTRGSAFWNPALQEAVKQGLSAEVKVLIELLNADVNTVDNGNSSPWELADEVKDEGKKAAVVSVLVEHSLHAAAYFGNEECVRALIAAGCDVNAMAGRCKRTPAHLAAVKGHGKALKPLLEAGTDANAVDQDQMTLWQRTEQMQGAGKTAVEEVLSQHSLHAAAYFGNEECVRALIAAACDVNATAGQYKRTPAHLAAVKGHGKALRECIYGGADVNAVDKDNRTPWELAYQVKDTDHKAAVEEVLSEHSLHAAAYFGNAELTAYLIAEGCDVNSTAGLNKKTPWELAGDLKDEGKKAAVVSVLAGHSLHAAAYFGKSECVRALIAAPGLCNVNAVDQCNRTPWDLAYQVKDKGKKAAVLSVLAEHSLHAAAFSGDAECVSSLIAAGRDVNATDDAGFTPMQRAAEGGHPGVCEALVRAGARSAALLSLRPVAESNNSHFGVMFDLVNTCASPVAVTTLIAAASSRSPSNAKLYVCRHGACKGREATAAAWDKVGAATLALKPASSGLVLAPAMTLRPSEPACVGPNGDQDQMVLTE
jgi:ankyrin repeat protein